MEIQDLECGLKSAAPAGCVLNVQEIMMLQSGLTLLKNREQYNMIYFWGKVFGQKTDYYVAYGLRTGDFEFPSKVFYFAGGDFQFQPLVAPEGEAAAKVAELCGEKPLTGEGGRVIEPPAEGEEEPQEEGQEPQEKKKLTEADRLAQLVQEIDFDTAAVPKGAYSLCESHSVVPSLDFKGLGFTEASSVASYVHFRAPVSVACRRALARDDAQFCGSFLDPLEADQPKGCWALRQDNSGELVTLRSLVWPGYVAFHVPGTKKFGGVYFGYAQKSADLPFLL